MHRPVVRQNNVFDDGEAETGSAQFAAAGFVNPVEAFEDAVVLLFGDSTAVIADADEDMILLLFAVDADRFDGGTVFDRVVDQIGHRTVGQ